MNATTQLQDALLAEVRQSPGLTTRAYADAVGCTTRQANDLLSVLFVRRLLARQKSLGDTAIRWLWYPEANP